MWPIRSFITATSANGRIRTDGGARCPRWRAQPTVCAATGENRNHVDGLRDQRARHGDDGFLDKLFEAAKGAKRRAGVNGADATGMAGAPGLEKVERLGPSHLTDRDSVGA